MIVVFLSKGRKLVAQSFIPPCFNHDSFSPGFTKHPQMLEKCQGAHYSRLEHIQGFRRWLVWIFHSNVTLHWPQLQIVVHTFHPRKEPRARKDNQMCDRVCSGMCILISAEQEERVQKMICDAFILPLKLNTHMAGACTLASLFLPETKGHWKQSIIVRHWWKMFTFVSRKINQS